jgi:cGMP-dependent protein kinase
VDAEPEILVWKITPNDKYIVIASDGVFEFITSQNVIDAIAKFKNILDAAKHVVAEAYRLWLTYDDRTDDITIIIIEVDNFQIQNNAAVETSNIKSNIPSAMTQLENKPVRKAMTKAKQKIISENWIDDKGEPFDFAANATEKVYEIIFIYISYIVLILIYICVYRLQLNYNGLLK